MRLHAFLKQYKNPVVIEIGAGVAIPTVRRFGEQFAPNLIRINPRDDVLPRQGGQSLALGAKAGIEQIYKALSENP